MDACKNAQLPPNSRSSPRCWWWHTRSCGTQQCRLDKRNWGTRKSPNSSDLKRKWKFLCTQIYQVVLINQRQCVIEHFLLISFLKIQIWNTGISFLFDHVVPQWPAGPLRSNHFYFYNRNLSNNRILPNNRRKSINQIFIIIRHFSINNRNLSIKHYPSQTEYK